MEHGHCESHGTEPAMACIMRVIYTEKLCFPCCKHVEKPPGIYRVPWLKAHGLFNKQLNL